ncbi:heat shock protein HslJ [Brevibacterium sanguinis]|uniref:Heat shock protein HslJ n=2 Tax=Brevibacterium TaxID=1696 RepID=A0A366IN38_9MICO|nr:MULTISPECIES: META domain-containing protein [Brevibacterium]RBP66245.1 heat shock protein HslJ [Brevibacterium sanguinis]RBP72896.1 heat shock protein HslJ [Brevibacterium celere]
MRSLRSAHARLLILAGLIALLALVLTACDTQEPTDGLGDGSAPETSEVVTPPDGSGPPSTGPGDTSGLDVEALTTGRWYAAGQGDPYLEFSPEGAVAGTDGCNAISSTWTAEGDTVKIKPFASTQKACAGVDTWLAKVSTVSVEGDTMTVLDIEGNEIGELTKVEK